MLLVIILVEVGSAIGLKTPYRRKNGINDCFLGTREAALLPHGS